jgi:hypothetical protein
MPAEILYNTILQENEENELRKRQTSEFTRRTSQHRDRIAGIKYR